jgi:sulfofructose kinase
LRAEGVDTSLLRRFPGARSAYSSVYVDGSGERQIMNFRGDGLTDDAGWIAEAGPVDAVLSDTRWGSGALAAMTHARSYGVPGVMDGEAPLHPPSLAAASHVAFSMQGFRDQTGGDDPLGLAKAAGDLSAWVCVTDGDKGVYAPDLDGQITRHPAYQIDVVDTLGAGDVWHGAFALALAEGKGETEAIHFASAVAALKCTRPGGRAGTPTRDETEAFLRENAR